MTTHNSNELHYIPEAVKIMYEHQKDCKDLKIDLKYLTEREMQEKVCPNV